MAVPESRIEAARRRLRVARYSIGAAAAAAFALFGVAVRDAHPATHSGSTVASTSATTAQSQAQEDSFSYDGGASIAPSSSNTPTVQSSGS
jgi:hypothetical protein